MDTSKLLQRVIKRYKYLPYCMHVFIMTNLCGPEKVSRHCEREHQLCQTISCLTRADEKSSSAQGPIHLSRCFESSHVTTVLATMPCQRTHRVDLDIKVCRGQGSHKATDSLSHCRDNGWRGLLDESRRFLWVRLSHYLQHQSCAPITILRVRSQFEMRDFDVSKCPPRFTSGLAREPAPQARQAIALFALLANGCSEPLSRRHQSVG